MSVTISLADNGGFSLVVPSDVNGSHTVLIPPTASGIAIMRKILSAREREEDRRIGHVSSPTQAQVEAWLRQDKLERAQAKAAAEEVKAAAQAKTDQSVLKGLDLGDLDL